MLQYQNIKKIGVISDTHIPTRAESLPEKISSIFKGVDLIIHCGDIVSDDVLVELSSIAPVAAVKGNMDSYGISLPVEEIIKINDTFTICASHGAGSPFSIKERLYKAFKQYAPSLVLYGHTHIAAKDEYMGIPFFNPGSPTAGSSFDSVGIILIEENILNTEVIKL